MKLPLLLLLSAVGFTASAQISNEEVIKNKLEELKKKLADSHSSAPYNFQLGPSVRADVLGAKPLAVPVKPGTYNLPQDGMPCIVPDTEGIAAMPNAAKVVKVPFRSQMPNAYKPKTEVPDLTK